MHRAGSVLSAKLARSYSASPTREIRSALLELGERLGRKVQQLLQLLVEALFTVSPLSAGQSLYNLGDCLLLAC
jgi:hypothetical protein